MLLWLFPNPPQGIPAGHNPEWFHNFILRARDTFDKFPCSEKPQYIPINNVLRKKMSNLYKQDKEYCQQTRTRVMNTLTQMEGRFENGEMVRKLVKNVEEIGCTNFENVKEE